ncbi:hypothetical protein BCR34DRAFT_597492 [Clohesyomyces aquaticus]|uniref:Uncharacterized protein n=1 Tax=Clohesyomyces aquaticus TaxID=1231657 RepID=A0A1Y2A2R7_9PLEO|nr:hypothetical protein BCR34DRAFT_597492 [Clohesyomyces aquaticus]
MEFDNYSSVPPVLRRSSTHPCRSSNTFAPDLTGLPRTERLVPNSHATSNGQHPPADSFRLGTTRFDNPVAQIARSAGFRPPFQGYRDRAIQMLGYQDMNNQGADSGMAQMRPLTFAHNHHRPPLSSSSAADHSRVSSTGSIRSHSDHSNITVPHRPHVSLDDSFNMHPGYDNITIAQPIIQSKARHKLEQWLQKHDWDPKGSVPSGVIPNDFLNEKNQLVLNGRPISMHLEGSSLSVLRELRPQLQPVRSDTMDGIHGLPHL